MKTWTEWMDEELKKQYYNSSQYKNYLAKQRGEFKGTPYDSGDWSLENFANNFDYSPYHDKYKEYLWHELGSGASGITAQNYLSSAGINLSPDQQQYLNNIMSTQASEAANEFTEHMRDTSYTSAGDQLSQLGLSPSNVISTGGAGIGGSSTPQLDNSNPALQRQLQEFQAKAGMTRTILGLLGGLASAGIGGTAYGLSRLAAAKVASSAAHSASSTISYYFDRNNNVAGHVIKDRRFDL